MSKTREAFINSSTSKVIIDFMQDYGNWHVCQRHSYQNASKMSLEYYYNNKIILNFITNDDQITHINIRNQITQLEFPADLLHRKLIILLIENRKSPKEILIKLSQNYFSGPQTDYLDYRLHHGLTIADYGIYGFNHFLHDELFPLLESEGIHHCLLNDSIWLRDYLLTSGNGEQLLHEDKILISEHMYDVLNSCLSSDKNQYVFRLNIKHESSATVGRTPDKVLDRHRLLTYCRKNNINHKKIDVLFEGGNIVTVEKDNKIWAIIGKPLMTATACYRFDKFYQNPEYHEAAQKFLDERRTKHPPRKTPEVFFQLNNLTYPFHTGYIKEAQYAMERELRLPHKQVIPVPNAEFHVDLQLCGGPNGIIFLNDYKMVSMTTMQDYITTGSTQSYEVYELALWYHEKVGDILDEIERKLTSKNFKVVRVPSVALSSQDVFIACFTNGFTGKGKNGYFHIALTSSINTLNDEFTKILKANGVNNVYLVGTPTLAEKLLASFGGLRCLSEPGNMFGSINNANGFQAEMSWMDESDEEDEVEEKNSASENSEGSEIESSDNVENSSHESSESSEIESSEDEKNSSHENSESSEIESSDDEKNSEKELSSSSEYESLIIKPILPITFTKSSLSQNKTSEIKPISATNFKSYSIQQSSNFFPKKRPHEFDNDFSDLGKEKKKQKNI